MPRSREVAVGPLRLGGRRPFLFIGGPVWVHTHERHFWRIGLSYGAIPFAVALALYRNRSLRLGSFVAGSAVIALLKLVATAGLLVLIAIAQS